MHGSGSAKSAHERVTRPPDLAPYMPNIKRIEERERTDNGPETRFINIWTASTEIPTLAQRYLTPEMLQWVDRARWDESQYSCDWVIETNAWPGVARRRR